MGLQKQYKHLEQIARNLPVMYNADGRKVNHFKVLKVLFHKKGTPEVNKYIRELYYAVGMSKIKNNENVDKLEQPDTEVSAED